MSEKNHRDGKLVYHLTHVDNLPSIVTSGLCSRRALQQRNHPFKDVANPEILSGRGQHGLDAYVPFHFIPKSPFDGAVVNSAADKRFVLISVSRGFARANGWRVCARHPLANDRQPELLAWDEGIEAIDWPTMNQPQRSYEDHETRMVCMAEALSPQPVTFGDFAFIYAPNQDVQAAAAAALLRLRPVQVNPWMFPKGCR